MLDLKPYSGSIGAEVRGIDLCQSLNESQFDELNKALLEHEVLFFRDQALKPECHRSIEASIFPSDSMNNRG